MPPRIARSSVQTPAPKKAGNRNRKRRLDPFAAASHSLPEEPGLRRNRLGEFLDDGPKQKRRRVVQKDDEEESDEEEIPSKSKRPTRNAGDLEEGSDSEGNEWTLGGLRDDDEDSELDSDEAFGESDEERFAGLSFRGSSSGKSKRPVKRKADTRLEDAEEFDLREEEMRDEEDEEEDDFGDEGVDLATMLDDEDEAVLGERGQRTQDMSAESEDSNDEEMQSASESDSEDEEGDAVADEERIARMRDRLEALDATQQSNKPTVTAPPTALTAESLLAAAGETQALKNLAKTRKKIKPVSVPLPPRQQNRLNREAASKNAKEQLDRWQDTVIRNRRAEFLSFPLQDPEQNEPLGKDKFINNGAPQNELEANIRKIMEESGMVSNNAEEDALMKSEQLAENHMPVEEVMRRRAELRRARELLFREEIKAKRISKIKSKAYRRVHRRERQRAAAYEKELLGPDDDDERERADRKRAEARMSTKHRDSKWAKSLRATNRGVWDEEARESVNELARRNEELRRRIAGEDVEGDSIEDDSADEDGNARMLEKLDRIRMDGAGGEDEKGLGNMKFMRAASERQKRRNEEDIERLRKDLAIEDGDEEEDEDEAVEDQGLGRAIFGPKGREKVEPAKKIKKPALEEGDVSEDGDEPEDEAEIVAEHQVTQNKSQIKSVLKKSKGANTTLNRSDRKEGTLPNAAERSSWLSAPLKGSKKDRLHAIVDAPLLGESTAPAKPVIQKKRASEASRKAVESQADATNVDGWTTVRYKGNADAEHGDVASESEAEPSNPILTHQQQNISYNRRAFAGDDVKAAFDAEKADAVESENEKEISNHLPGWGSWTGEGLSKSIRKANTRQRHNPLYKTKLPGVKAEDRKDAKLENVIVSEKQDRKGRKYKADILPHGFEKKEQYERSLRIPTGPEWVTKETFQRNTRPRVVVKPGVVVAAMERPLV